jgi:hypothetical protein
VTEEMVDDSYIPFETVDGSCVVYSPDMGDAPLNPWQRAKEDVTAQWGDAIMLTNRLACTLVFHLGLRGFSLAGFDSDATGLLTSMEKWVVLATFGGFFINMIARQLRDSWKVVIKGDPPDESA